MIENQKNYYSDPISRAFDQIYLNHSSCVQGLIRGICFVFHLS